MKKAVILLLVLCVALSGFGAAAESPAAAEQSYTGDYMPLPDSLSEGVYRTLYEGMLNHETEVSLSQYRIPTSAIDDVFTAFDFLVSYYPELFAVDGSISLSYDNSHVITATLGYTMSDEEYAVAREQYNHSIAEIVAMMPSDFSDLEKIVFVHDYFVEHYEYDLSYSINDAYSFFVQKTGVCAAYSKAFIAVMRALHIECTRAIDADENHEWNLVKLNGKFYHVDVSHDDPTPDRTGQIYHNLLLLSDDTICQKNSHHQWMALYDSRISCTDTQYESYAWINTQSPLVYLDDSWYMLTKEGVLNRLFRDFKTATAVQTVGGRWSAGENKYWVGFFSGLFRIGNTLFGNTPNGFWSYRPSDQKRVDYSLTTNRNIYGSVYEGGGTIRYVTLSNPNADDGVFGEFQLLLGDSDGNNRVDALDLANARHYLLTDSSEGFNYGLLDMDCDWQITIFDLIRLKKMLAGIY